VRPLRRLVSKCLLSGSRVLFVTINAKGKGDLTSRPASGRLAQQDWPPMDHYADAKSDVILQILSRQLMIKMAAAAPR
jgi:hypothetical protein